MNASLRDLVRRRAGQRCEYCRIHQDEDPFFTFPVDHIIAIQHRGATDADNLCLSCYRCNAHKGPNIASLDPHTGELAPLFHPRHDQWEEHFKWRGAVLMGKTAVGRATVELLAINHSEYIQLRTSLMDAR
jgi:hypothetical protein